MRYADKSGGQRPAFIITIDAEGDNIWSRPSVVETRNALYLPRFQTLCDKYGFKPTYLTNYEMASSPIFCEFARDVLAREAAEIGMHLHAWDSPPIMALTSDDRQRHPFLIDFPRSQMRDKIAKVTDLLEDCFGHKMRSHRAGRWAFNEVYAELLLERGYCVDCSVTPGVSWAKTSGAPGRFGTDYSRFPDRPYFMDPFDISRPGNSSLLQVPMSIHRSWFTRHLPSVYNGTKGRVLRRLGRCLSETQGFRLTNSDVTWLRPNGRNKLEMIKLVDWARGKKYDHLEFMLHSSELMPGGSPTFGDETSIEQLYADMDLLFADISRYCVGCTLSEYHDRVLAARG